MEGNVVDLEALAKWLERQARSQVIVRWDVRSTGKGSGILTLILLYTASQGKLYRVHYQMSGHQVPRHAPGMYMIHSNVTATIQEISAATVVNIWSKFPWWQTEELVIGTETKDNAAALAPPQSFHAWFHLTRLHGMLEVKSYLKEPDKEDYRGIYEDLTHRLGAHLSQWVDRLQKSGQMLKDFYSFMP